LAIGKSLKGQCSSPAKSLSQNTIDIVLTSGVYLSLTDEKSVGREIHQAVITFNQPYKHRTMKKLFSLLLILCSVIGFANNTGLNLPHWIIRGEVGSAGFRRYAYYTPCLHPSGEPFVISRFGLISDKASVMNLMERTGLMLEILVFQQVPPIFKCAIRHFLVNHM